MAMNITRTPGQVWVENTPPNKDWIVQLLSEIIAGSSELLNARSLSTVTSTLVTTDPATPNQLVMTRPVAVANIPEQAGSLLSISVPFVTTGPVTINGKPLTDGSNLPLRDGDLRPVNRYIIRYSQATDSYLLVTSGVTRNDLRNVGSSATIGVSPVVYDATLAGDRQWLPAGVYDVPARVYAIEVWAAAVGEIEVAAFFGSNPFTKAAIQTVKITKTGPQVILLDQDILLQPGERVGWWATPGIIRATASTPDGFGGYYSNGSTNPGKEASFTAPGITTNVRFGINFRVWFGSNTGALATALSALRSVAKTAVAGSASWPETTSYVLVWAVGQSNGAGRGRTASSYTIESGRGYKYNPTNGIVHLTEPTGTDTLALSGNYVSFGSGLAQAVLEATQGRVGVIIVNSCVGATAIANWAEETPAWTNAQAQIAAALADIKAKKLNVIGTIAAFCQGEGNALSSGSGGTMPDYKAGVLSLLSRMRTEIALPRMRMLIAQTGSNSETGDTSFYAAVRQAQTELANDSDGSILMAHTGARYFPERGLMFDDLHYTTQGYDEIGSALGAAAAAYGIGLRPPSLDI
ncbi:MAG: sialate O-acetylesterase [Paracoccus sp.]|nr:sialate O-acetylesterase [Paracoccus sp. (in: a-proteobacteria)]